MIGRVTQGYMVSDFNSTLRSREEELNRVQKQLASGYRIDLPSDDPVGTVNYMAYDSRLSEISTYQSIVDSAQSKLKTTDGTLDSATSVLQRMREIAVQGANGTYTKDEREKMAVEVDQLLRELHSLSNTRYKNDALFGGTMTDDNPFAAQFRTDDKTGIEFMESVRYIGNNQTQETEVDRDERITSGQPGNQVFWADQMIVQATINSSAYVAPKDSKISVDGVEIGINAGDSLDVIAQKINSSGAAVKASFDTRDGFTTFMVQATSPHQIALQDLGGGAVFQDLGLVDDGMKVPNNYSPQAKVFTGSIFDTMIQFRRSLQSDDVFKIGGTALGMIDKSLDNLLKYRANLGAVSERLDIVAKRFSSDQVYLTEAKDNEIGTDIPKAMTEMKMLEFSHDVALQIGARILPRTLLDFLR